MPINDPAVLKDPFRGAVVAWLAASKGAFWISSGLRTRQEQIDLRVSNGCPDIFTSPASTCRIPTAIPGTSKHERGEAVDVAGDKALAARLAPRFGLGLTVPGEDWHFEVVDATTAAQYPYNEEFTVEQFDRLIAAIEDLTKVVKRQGELTRKTVRRQALLTRLDVKRAAKADQADLDAILDELAQLGAEEAEG